MDSSRWPGSSGQSDRKRTYQQMQRSRNSELEFADSFTSFLPNQHRPSRPSLQHNNTTQNPFTTTSFDFVDNMADRVRHRATIRPSPYHPPRLQHRSSQTVIDLTGDSDEFPSPPQAQVPSARSAAPRRHTQRPPRLGRDDILGGDLADVLIDLTDDIGYQSEAELEVVGSQQRQPAPPRPHHHTHHNHSHHHRPRGFDYRRPANQAPPQQHPPPPAPPAAGGLFLAHGPNDPYRPRPNISRFSSGGLSGSIQRAVMAALPVQHHSILGLLGGRGGQELNMALNYDAVAFVGPPSEPQKTPHVPPQPAQAGFTRSPAALKDDEILICPACEEELVQVQSTEPAATTNSRGKALTNKERAEHPFWVVRKCGHVFCNKCYQDRKNKSEDSKFYPPGGSKNDKTMVCPVEDCCSPVAKPAEWIGVFL